MSLSPPATSLQRYPWITYFPWIYLENATLVMEVLLTHPRMERSHTQAVNPGNLVKVVLGRPGCWARLQLDVAEMAAPTQRRWGWQ